MIATPSSLTRKRGQPFGQDIRAFFAVRGRTFRRIHEALRRALRSEPLEFSQMLTRYAVGIAITVYAILSPVFERHEGSSTASITLLMSVAWTIALSLLAHLAIYPERRIARRTVSICMDAFVVSLLIHYGERSAAIFFPVYLWVILGNGFRFGIQFMSLSMVANAASFIIMVLLTPYWRQEWQFSAGLLVALIAIPIYTSSLIRKLRSSMNQARAASTAKSAFLSMISHELRTPLNAILGLAQVSKTTATTTRERENAAFTEIAANRLTRMLDTILKFQAVESGKGQVQERCFDVIDTLTEVESILAPLAWKKKLKFNFRFRTALPKTLRSDPDIIQTIVINLASNVIKYTKIGFVAVEVALVGDGESVKLCIDVHDSGAGIDPDMQARIFDQFVRAVPRGAEDEGGVGLGLSLCKSLIHLLGGEIGCRSAMGQGSTFWVEIPAGYVEDAERLQSTRDRRTSIGALGLDVPGDAAIRHEFRCLEEGKNCSALTGQVSDPNTNIVFIAEPKRVAPADWDQFCKSLDSTAAPAPLIVVESDTPADSDCLARATGIVDSVRAISPELIRTLVDWSQRHCSRSAVPQEAPACASKVVLVADDNEMNREVAGKMLKLDGHTVLEAQTGDEALEKLLAHEIDVAILDVNMPEQDGIEVCKLYQATVSRESRAVIVALTADISEETRSRCLAAGMSEVLHKPLALEELRALLARTTTNTNDRGTTPISSSPRTQEEDSVFDEGRMRLLIEMFGSDAFSNKILPRFEREAREGVEQLKSNISHLHLENIKQILHAIKSSAKTIGALQLAKSAAVLEEFTARDGETPSYESLEKELEIFDWKFLLLPAKSSYCKNVARM
jgi:two-component system, sensor histidine kinase RpfC